MRQSRLVGVAGVIGKVGDVLAVEVGVAVEATAIFQKIYLCIS